MGSSRKPGDYAGTPGRGALTYLKNYGAAQRGRKIHQFTEGVVTALIPGDVDHLMVRWPFSSGPKKLPVRYGTCNSQAFRVGDHVLVFARNCEVSASEVIGFTRGPRPCGFEAKIFGILGRHDPAIPDFPEPKQNLQLVQVGFTDETYLYASHTNVGGLLSASGSALAYTMEYSPNIIDSYDRGRVTNYRPNAAFYNVSSHSCGWDYQDLIDDWVSITVIGARHGNHVHQRPEDFRTPYVQPSEGALGSDTVRQFPLSAVSSQLGDAGIPMDPFFIEYITTFAEYRSIPGWTWNGLQYCLATGKLVVMGVIGGTQNTGAILVDPVSGAKTQLWRPTSASRLLTTFKLEFKTCARHIVDPYYISFTAPDPNPNEDFDLGFPGDPSYGLAIGDSSGCVSLPERDADGGFGNHAIGPDDFSQWGYSFDVYSPFSHLVRFTEIDEEVLTGVPSPPIATSPSTSYVLIPCVHRRYKFGINPDPAPGWSPGTSSPEAAPEKENMDFGGEVLRTQRLYSVHVESGSATLVHSADVTTTSFDDSSLTNENRGQKTFAELESRSQRRVFNYVQGSGRTGPSSPLARWWNPINRPAGQGYPVNPDIFTQIPFVSPGGMDFPVNGNPRTPGYPWQRYVPAGNWVAMDPGPTAPVAAWAFVWTGEEDTVRLETLAAETAPPQGRQVYDQDYLGDTNAYVGDHFAEYAWDAPRNPIAHGDTFCVYSAITGAELEQLIVGSRTNPGSYLTCPTVTPNGDKMLFTAHGWFTIPPLGVRFFAGMYYVDRTNRSEPVITFISPCELRVPGRSTITALDAAGGPLATGEELVESLPSEDTILPDNTSYESELAYFIGARRKSFLNRAGTLLLAESGYMLDLTDVTRPVLNITGIVELRGLTASSEVAGVGPLYQDVEQLYRGFIPLEFP